MQVSYGIVGFDVQTRRVLLVRQQGDASWSFPKGIPKEGEAPEQTAIREFREEVGLDVLTLFGSPLELTSSPLELQYDLPESGERKKTVLFLASVGEHPPSVQASEIDECRWLSLDQALSLQLYPNIRAILEGLSRHFDSSIAPLKKVAVLQSFFLPWLGVFNQIASADTFVVGDNFRFSKNSWINRNRVKRVSGGSQWLTVPIKNKDAIKKNISDVEISYEADWRKDHLFTIRCVYKNSPGFDGVYSEIEQAFRAGHGTLFALNHDLLLRLLRLMNVPTRIVLRSDYMGLPADKSESLVEIVKRECANCYLTGPSARDYLNEDLFHRDGILIEYQRFSAPAYTQLWGEFVPRLSVIDALFNVGIEKTREIIYAGR